MNIITITQEQEWAESDHIDRVEVGMTASSSSWSTSSWRWSWRWKLSGSWPSLHFEYELHFSQKDLIMYMVTNRGNEFNLIICGRRRRVSQTKKMDANVTRIALLIVGIIPLHVHTGVKFLNKIKILILIWITHRITKTAWFCKNAAAKSPKLTQHFESSFTSNIKSGTERRIHRKQSIKKSALVG